MKSPMGFTTCSECGAPAEITDIYTLPSTDGPVTHRRVSCVNLHHITQVEPWTTTP